MDACKPLRDVLWSPTPSGAGGMGRGLLAPMLS